MASLQVDQDADGPADRRVVGAVVADIAVGVFVAQQVKDFVCVVSLHERDAGVRHRLLPFSLGGGTVPWSWSVRRPSR
jgi:hypothetical protein